MFPFLGELLCFVAWLIGQSHEVLRHVLHRVPVLPVSRGWMPHVWSNLCDSSWPANAERWLAVGPPWGWPLHKCGQWRLSAVPVTAAFPSRCYLRG